MSKQKSKPVRIDIDTYNILRRTAEMQQRTIAQVLRRALSSPLVDMRRALGDLDPGRFTAETHPIPPGILDDYTEQEKADFANEWQDDTDTV